MNVLKIQTFGETEQKMLRTSEDIRLNFWNEELP